MPLQVLLVDDDPADLKNFERDFPEVFKEVNCPATLHSAGNFEDAFKLCDDPSRRFDLILTDTFRGEQKRHDAAAIDLVNRYRGKRFCPIVVFSASAKPEGLTVGDFVTWADKSESGGIEKAIKEMVATGIPQAARSLHDDLDRLGGSYLWEFLDKNWSKLKEAGHSETDTLTRIIRRRAALQLTELAYSDAGANQVSEVHGIEFYVYPPLNPNQYSLGEVVQNKTKADDIRVILTPHCYMTVQSNQTKPRAEYIVTVLAIPVKRVLSADKIANTKALTDVPRKHKKLSDFVTPPSKQDVGKPEGRYWYLPAYMDIPHLYCDLMQTHSLAFEALRSDYKSLAVLSPPYAESLQACYVAFHAAVGIPNVKPSSVEGLLD